MNATELSVVQRILLDGLVEAGLNSTLRKLNSIYGIGHIAGKKIYFKESCHDAMRKLYSRYAKNDETVERPKNLDRVEAVRFNLNEKSGSKAVFGDLLQVSSMGGIRLQSGFDVPMALMGGVALVVSLDHLDVAAIERLVIVENGAMLRHLPEWVSFLPKCWQSALFVYRGHEANVATLNTLIARLPDKSLICYYGDFDLGAIRVAQGLLGLKPLEILIPEHWMDIKRTDVDNNEQKFEKQFIKLSTPCKNKQLRSLQLHVISNRLAIMQENFRSIGRLVTVNLKH